MRRRFIHFISSAHIFFYALLWLMVLLVSGTIAQRSVGLYQSQQTFFSSFLFFVGPIPLPGGYMTLGIIFLNLFAKLIFKSPWTKSRFGINVIHVGALMLLFGGFLTAVMNVEGALVLAEGEKSHLYSDYHELEFSVMDQQHETHFLFPEKKLSSGERLPFFDLPVKMTIANFYRNCHIVQRSTLTNQEYHGFAKIFELQSLPLEKEDTKNRACLSLRVEGIKKENEGIYAVMESMPIEQTLEVNEKKYILSIRRKERQLPFSIELLDFEKKMHAGTDMAKSYRSQVFLLDGELRESRVIEMNRPLRYKGYTLYQASFIEGLDQETSVFAVVRNTGRLFPYLSSIVMCAGLLLHLFSSVPNLIRKRRA
ncbi:MAG: hypothetical protein A3I05_07935 [Deltaproteobacteria bacterium RIFCSPLOWO2_02_FULL_44_10]|nr:MAG: hypothetical protein A3C46_01785 [Deltaproteobacteria bacterium RIFCSPHIGHO2_02_FULL_44_16]OGQ45615.1 MAG: hypothetical protein A3I05_07935 [Deltaproteobacteria bacterium RIFCSPLOWO2_02_FULL_44_10]